MGVGALKDHRRQAVFLDRDGVLNRGIIRGGRSYPPANLDELEIPAGVAEALQSLKAPGFALYVVTNQPDISRGTQTRSMVDQINRSLAAQLPLDGVYVCPHDDRDHCGCRKPKPGMLLAAAAEHSISLADSYMIGDRWRDVEAGQRAGCRTIWLHAGYAERAPTNPPDATLDSLPQAAGWILERERQR